MISIIVPIYKVEGLLDRCVQSILYQTYTDLQIILVDDGSPDGCGAMCDMYQRADKRIQVIHKPNGGLSDARNAGLRIAEGEYVGFVDSDDYIHPEMYETLLHNLSDTHSDVSICGFQRLDEGQCPGPAGDNKLHVFENSGIIEQLVENNNMKTVVAWNKLYKREIFDGIWYEKGRIREDEFIIYDILSRAQRIVYTDMEMYYYIKRAGSIIGSNNVKGINDLWDALDIRSDIFRGVNERMYSLTRRQQLALPLSECWWLSGTVEGRMLVARILKEGRKIGRDGCIWKYFPWRFRVRLRMFLISPCIYRHLDKIIGDGKNRKQLN